MLLTWAKQWRGRFRQRSFDPRPWSELAAWPGLRGASLALVGNAGYLAKLEQGEAIDGHDVVIRMNNFRVGGFERAVGRRTDVLLTNFFKDIDFANPEFQHARMLVSSSPNNFRKLRRLGIHHRHADYITRGMNQLGRRRVYVPPVEWFGQQIAAIGQYPSTGAMGILLILEQLLGVCGPVHVTGFSFFQCHSHYFSNRYVSTINHDPMRERSLIQARLRPWVQSGRITVDASMQADLERRAA